MRAKGVQACEMDINDSQCLTWFAPDGFSPSELMSVDS